MVRKIDPSIAGFLLQLKTIISGLLILFFSQCGGQPQSIAGINQSAIKMQYPLPVLSQWRGANRDGIYPDKNLLTHWPEGGPALIWKYDSLGVGYSSVAVTNDKIFTIGTLKGISSIFTFNHQGKLLWKKELGPEWIRNYPGSRGTPIICDDYGYILNGLGVLFCFNINNGTIVWTKDIVKEYNGRIRQCGYSENLIVSGDKLFCTPAGIEISVVALNRKTGELIWKSKGNGEESAYATPIIIERGAKKLFVNQMFLSIIALDTENGNLVWTYKLGAEYHPNTLTYKDGCIFAIENWASQSVKLKLSEDGRSVKEVWKTQNMAAEQGDVVILGDRIYGADVDEKSFSCIDWNTGKQLYKITRKGKPLVVSVISADSLLYCYDSEGDFYLVKPLRQKFETCGHFTVPGTKFEHYAHPVIHNRRLYVRHKNNLFVYNLADDQNKSIAKKQLSTRIQ